MTTPSYPFVPTGAVRLTVWPPTTSWPQLPTGTVPTVTGWPSTTRFVTPLPLALPPAPDSPVPADALALTASAVTSPPKSETPVTTLSAFAAAFCSTVVVAMPSSTAPRAPSRRPGT